MVQNLQLCIVLACLLFKRVFILGETHAASATTVHEIKHKIEQGSESSHVLSSANGPSDWSLRFSDGYTDSTSPTLSWVMTHICMDNMTKYFDLHGGAKKIAIPFGKLPNLPFIPVLSR